MTPGSRLKASALCRLLDDWSPGPGSLPERLSYALAALIERGDLPDGTLMPSQRDLAEALRVARGTVTAAFTLLESTDHLQSRPGSGSRVRSPGARGAGTTHGGGRLASLGGHDLGLVDLSSGALPGLSYVAAALDRIDRAEVDREVAEDGYHPLGLQRLREAVARQYTRDGLPTGADQILVTAGSQQALWLLAQTLLSRGDDILVEDPTYRGALEAFQAIGATLTTVAVRDDGLDLNHLRGLLRSGHRRLLYCQPTAQNPTGASATASDLRDLAGLVSQTGIRVIEDTSNADLILDHRGHRPYLASLCAPEAVVGIGSASKLWWGGLRIGWLRAEPGLILRLAAVRKLVDLSSAVIDQILVANLLPATARARQVRTEALARSLSTTEELLGRRRPNWTWTTPTGGSALWLDIHDDAVAAAELALRHGVRLASGPAFSAFDGQRTRLKLPFWHPPEILAEALDRLP